MVFLPSGWKCFRFTLEIALAWREFAYQKPYILSGVACINECSMQKSRVFYRMGNSEGLKYELAVRSAEAWLFQSTQSYILSFPSTDLDLECALMNFMHANFQLRTLPKETEAQYLPNRRGLNLKMSTPTPQRQALEKEMTVTGM